MLLVVSFLEVASFLEVVSSLVWVVWELSVPEFWGWLLTMMRVMTIAVAAKIKVIMMAAMMMGARERFAGAGVSGCCVGVAEVGVLVAEDLARLVTMGVLEVSVGVEFLGRLAKMGSGSGVFVVLVWLVFAV